MALTVAERKSLTKNRVELIRSLIPSEEFYAYFLADRSLTECMVEQIKSWPVSQNQNAQLLDMLYRRPQKALHTFIFALVATDQEHLAELLNPTLTAQYVKERDVRRGDVDQFEYSASQSTHQEPGGVLLPSGQNASKYFELASTPSSSNPSNYCQPASELSSCQSSSQSQPPVTSSSPQSMEYSSSSGQSSQQPATTNFNAHAFSGPVAEDPETCDIIHDLSEQIATFQLVGSISSVDVDAVKSQLNGIGHCVQNGFALVVYNKTGKAGEMDLELQFAAIQQFFEKSSFKRTEPCENYTFANLQACLKSYECELESCDAFLLYFLGHGGQDGTVMMVDGPQTAIYHDILPLFNSGNCGSLSGKPKLFIFHLAETDPVKCEVDSPCDSVDALVRDPCWADMIILRNVLTVTPGKNFTEGEMNTFMLPFHALVKVAVKFMGQRSVGQVLKKVGEILLQLREKGQNSIVACEFNETPLSGGKLPLYLLMK